MKKITLSLVASTALAGFLMAGGDIAPVEPTKPVEVSGWQFGGQGVAYYQTSDLRGGDLFDQDNSRGNVGIQLRAINDNILYGIGAGFEVDGIATLNAENSFIKGGMQTVNADNSGGWVSQAYLTYNFGNTNIKAGRQELNKEFSPFAFSENWNVFRNTFDAVTVVNTDFSNTTLVGAWVYGGNVNSTGSDMTDFASFNDSKGVWMFTAQNKSINSLTLTGTWYIAPSFGNDDLNILWGSADYAISKNCYVSGQAGTWISDDFQSDSLAAAIKTGGKYKMFEVELAASTVDDGGVQGISTRNLGGEYTPLYTQMILNQRFIDFDSDTYTAKVGTSTSYGDFGIAYGYSDLGSSRVLGNGDFQEVDLTYNVAINDVDLFAGYVYQDADYSNGQDFSDNVLRFWARYNF